VELSSKAVVLTPRELDVLRLLAGGCTYSQAAGQLGISPHTVMTHIKNAYRKLDAHTAACAVARAIRRGLLEPKGGAE
jgi:two-component system nitrate/nitrite response regulator NarL